MLAQQGENAMEIADDLCRGYNTVRNQLKAIFLKLDVHSIAEAIEMASNNHILYVPKQHLSASKQPPDEAPRKRTRVLITDEMIQLIQQHLDDGLSMRKAAEKAGISECAIRYWKGKGKLI